MTESSTSRWVSARGPWDRLGRAPLRPPPRARDTAGHRRAAQARSRPSACDRRINWLGEGAARHRRGAGGRGQLRSTQPPLPARLFLGAAGAGEAVLEAPADAVAPGQACVFYDGERLLGGGWICRTATAAAATPASLIGSAA